MNGVTLDASQEEYTWNSSTGALSIPNVSGYLSITVSGVQIMRNVTINATNVTADGASTVGDGDTYTATFTPDTHYSLPSSITVKKGSIYLEICLLL